MSLRVWRKRKEAVAPEAQLLTDLIQPEQASGQGKFEIPQLPSNDRVAAAPGRVGACSSR